MVAHDVGPASHLLFAVAHDVCYHVGVCVTTTEVVTVAKRKLSAAEQYVHNQFMSGSYAGYGVCANPACAKDAYCYGADSTARICIECFEYVFNSRHPSKKKIAAMRARA